MKDYQFIASHDTTYIKRWVDNYAKQGYKIINTFSQRTFENRDEIVVIMEKDI